MATLILPFWKMRVLRQIVEDHMVGEIETESADGERVARSILASIDRCLPPARPTTPGTGEGE